MKACDHSDFHKPHCSEVSSRLFSPKNCPLASENATRLSLVNCGQCGREGALKMFRCGSSPVSEAARCWCEDSSTVISRGAAELREASIARLPAQEEEKDEDEDSGAAENPDLVEKPPIVVDISEKPPRLLSYS